MKTLDEAGAARDIHLVLKITPDPQPAPAPRARGRKAVKVEPRAILEAALQVFAEQGVSGASLRAIAKGAGCDPALIYYHFGSKEGIFEALLDELFQGFHQDLADLVQATAGEPTRERLRQVMDHLVGHLQARGRGLQGVVRGEVVRGAEGVRASLARRLRPILDLLRQIFAEGMARGEVRTDLPLPLLPFFFMRPLIEILELIPAMSVHVACLPPEEALPMALKAWFDLFWRGVSAAPPPSAFRPWSTP